MVGQFLALWRTKTLEGVVSRAPSQRKVFWTFYQHALRYQFETWYIHLVGSATHEVRVSSPWPTLQPRMGQCNFLHLWHQKLYRAFRFGTLWPISCSYPRHSQLTRHSLMLANGRIRQSLTALVKFSLPWKITCTEWPFDSVVILYSFHWSNFCIKTLLRSWSWKLWYLLAAIENLTMFCTLLSSIANYITWI